MSLFNLIDTQGSIGLAQSGSDYLIFAPASAGSPNFLPPSTTTLKYSGSAVLTAQFGVWRPIAVEASTSGYEVIWKEGQIDAYLAWLTDSNGNYVSDAFGVGSANSNTLQSLETVFQQDLNQDGLIGPNPQTIIEGAGSVYLEHGGGNYFLQSQGQGPTLKYQGSPVIIGQFGEWSPVGVEITLLADNSRSGFEVIWKQGSTDLYTVWLTDVNGNYISDTLGFVPGNSPAIQSLETNFHQDFNSDGIIGVSLPETLIESNGLIGLVQVQNNYLFGDTSHLVELQYLGAPVTTGQFGNWTPIGAEFTGNDTATYLVAWKAADADQYTIWKTDYQGNYISDTLGIVPGHNATLEFLEYSTFHQDLNGDGFIGLNIAPSVIELVGDTGLLHTDSNYFMLNESQSDPTSPYLHPISELQYLGSPVSDGEFADWVPIAAEKGRTDTLNVVWKQGGEDLYTIWTVDTFGNYVSEPLGLVHGSNPTLQFLESNLFYQDLNGDGVLGLNLPQTAIESDGSIGLVQVTDNYFFTKQQPAPYGTSYVELQYQNTPVSAGQFGSWAPIAVEATSLGYQVAWKETGFDHYTTWTTDFNGNYTGELGRVVSGSDPALQSLESAFQQDLNGDGIIGINPHTGIG